MMVGKIWWSHDTPHILISGKRGSTVRTETLRTRKLRFLRRGRKERGNGGNLVIKSRRRKKKMVMIIILEAFMRPRLRRKTLKVPMVQLLPKTLYLSKT